jgi:hypothetical protein
MEETVPREVAVAKVEEEAVRKAVEKIVPMKNKAGRKVAEETDPFPVVVARQVQADSAGGLPTDPGPSGRSAEIQAESQPVASYRPFMYPIAWSLPSVS